MTDTHDAVYGRPDPTGLPPHVQQALNPTGKPTAHPFPIYGVSDFLAPLKPIDWLVGGLIEKEQVGFLFGPPGSYKSLIALDMAMRVSLGMDYYGRKVHRQRVLYMLGEGQAGFQRRLQAWIAVHQIQPDPDWCSVSTMPAHFSDAAKANTVEASMREHFRDSPPGLVVVDTYSRHRGASDENSNDSASQFLTTMHESLRIPFGCSVMVIHHPPKGENAMTLRGGSALEGDSDFVLHCGVDRHANVATITPVKLKEGDLNQHICLKSVPVDLEDAQGNRVISYAIKESVELPQKDETGKTLGRNQQKVLDTLQQLYSAALTGNPNVPARIPETDLRDACKLARNRFPEAVDGLLSKRKISAFGAPPNRAFVPH